MHEQRMNFPRNPADDMSLVEYVRVLWADRLGLGVGVIVGVLIALGITLTTPRTFEATASIMMATSKLGEDARMAGLSVATVRELVSTRAAVGRVVQQLGLDRPPYALNTATLGNLVRVDEVRNTPIVRVTARMQNPEMAASVANALAATAIDQLNKSNQKEVITTRDHVKTQRDQAAANLDELQARLTAFKRQSLIDWRKRDVVALLDQRQAYGVLLLSIEEDKAWIAKARAELATRQRLLTLNRSLDTQGTMADAARAKAVAPLQMHEQQLDPVYSALESEIALRTAKLSSLETKRAELVRRYGIDSAEQSKLAALYGAEIELARLEADHQIASTIYGELVKKYEDARLQVISRTSELQIIDPATPPESHVAPRPSLYVLIGALIGLIGSILIVTARVYFSPAPARAPLALT